MAHAVETMVSGNRITPWHKLGKVVDGQMTAADVIVAADLGWNVRKVPLYAPGFDGDVSALDKLTQVPHEYAVVRDKDNKVLGTVKGRYQVVQNVDAFKVFDGIAERGEAIYETAGSLHGGKVIWIMARVPAGTIRLGKGGRDVVEPYLLYTASHDGKSKIKVRLNTERVVCANTLGWALEEAGDVLELRHTKNVGDRLEQATDIMGIARREMLEFEEAAKAMVVKRITPEELNGYFARVLKVQEKLVTGEDGEQRFHNLTDLQSTSLTWLKNNFESGAGAEMNPGTVWNALNAVTEFVDWQREYKDENAYLRNVGFEGVGQEMKQRALVQARNLVRA